MDPTQNSLSPVHWKEKTDESSFLTSQPKMLGVYLLTFLTLNELFDIQLVSKTMKSLAEHTIKIKVLRWRVSKKEIVYPMLFLKEIFVSLKCLAKEPPLSSKDLLIFLPSSKKIDCEKTLEKISCIPMDNLAQMMQLIAFYQKDGQTFRSFLYQHHRGKNTTDSNLLNRPLLKAYNYSDHDGIQFLFSKGAKSNFYTKEHHTLLTHSISHHFFKTAKFLLSQKEVDVNVKNEQGKAPIHYAIQIKWAAGIEILKERGAYLHISDNEGNTPLNYAQQYCPNHRKVMALLKKGSVTSFL